MLGGVGTFFFEASLLHAVLTAVPETLHTPNRETSWVLGFAVPYSSVYSLFLSLLVSRKISLHFAPEHSLPYFVSGDLRALLSGHRCFVDALWHLRRS